MFTPRCKKEGLKQSHCGIRHRLQWAVSWIFHSLSLCPPEYPSSQGGQPRIPCTAIVNPKSKDLWVIHPLSSGLYIECTMVMRLGLLEYKLQFRKGGVIKAQWFLVALENILIWPGLYSLFHPMGLYSAICEVISCLLASDHIIAEHWRSMLFWGP